MTVGELKEELKDIPNDYNVFITDMNNKVKVPFGVDRVNVREYCRKIFIESENAIENLQKKCENKGE